MRTASGLVASLVLTFAAASPVFAQDKRALGQFRVAFRTAKTHKNFEYKQAALEAIRGIDSGPAAKALLQAYASLEREAEPLRTKRRPVLFRGGGSATLAPLRDKLQPVRDLQDGILAQLRRLRSEAAVRALLGVLVRPRSSLPLTLRLAVADRTGAVSGDDIARILDATGKVRSSDGVLVLLRALQPLGTRAKKAAAWATKQLGHASEDIRKQAMATLQSLRWPGSLQPLIDRLDTERGEAREKLLDVLVVLTGKYPGDTASAWQRWLDAEGGPFLAGKVRLGWGSASIRKRKKGSQTTGSYFGIGQKGQSILYVFDVSLSMRASMVGGGFGPGRGGLGRQAPPGKSRWDRCKKELHTALDKLTPNKTFNLIGFANHLVIYSEKMQKATKANLAKAHAWIDGLKLELETNIHDALELAFCMAGRGVQDRYYPVVADTIFFLSDGAPTRPNTGRPRPDGGGTRGGGRGGPMGGNRRFTRDDPNQILSAVRRWNGLGRVVIHTIGLGLRQGGRMGSGRRAGGAGGGASDFLRQLAKQNGGTFVQPK